MTADILIAIGVAQLAENARPVAQHCMGIVTQADRIKGIVA